MNAIIGDVTPFPCLVREWPAGSFSVAMLALDKASGDLVPLDEWPIRNVSEAEARAVMTLAGSADRRQLRQRAETEARG